MDIDRAVVVQAINAIHKVQFHLKLWVAFILYTEMEFVIRKIGFMHKTGFKVF